MKTWVSIALALAALTAVSPAQQHDFSVIITKGDRPAIAVPDLRGDGQAQSLMAAFNNTLWSDLDGAGIFKMVPKSLYPKTAPQLPADFRVPPPVNNAPVRGRKKTEPPPPQNGGGLWMSDWSGPPPQANYLAMGYAAVQNGLFVLRGWLMDMRRDTPANSQVLGNTYPESLDEPGAVRAAHKFAADILALFGAPSLFGSHIYFVRQQGPNKEIWGMDADGKNQKQITHYNTLTEEPAISPDGASLAFISLTRGEWGIFVFSVDPVHDMRFYNQRGASVTNTPSFTPDGKQLVFASSLGGHCCRIYAANLDGSGLRPVSSSNSLEAEPKVNPKTGADLAFVSGRDGHPQIYRMNMDGADLDRLSDGTGSATNPAWHPNGQTLAYAWTRGYDTGQFNIFIMDVASRQYQQLTHGEGRNENPSWAPDGKHIVFASTRTGRSQIWTMLADGTHLQQLTTQGANFSPVWGK